ncbi:MAG: ion transporter [Candidatus Cloacimonetes bacterium]|nr:ion transporter [Candidatus Cloacimonadota bacterium]
MSEDLEQLKRQVSNVLDFADSFRAKVVQFVLLLINLFACFLCVLSTYVTDTYSLDILHNIDIALAVVFIIEYALRMWSSRERMAFCFSFYSIVDLLSIIPTFLGSFGMGYLRFLRVFRILRFSRYLEDGFFFFGELSELHLQFLKVVFSVITIVFIFSGFIHFLESAHNPKIHTWGEACYFIVITMSTVGYGDVTPITDFGKWATVLMIFCSAILVPWQAGKLIRMAMIMESGFIMSTCESCGLKRHDHDASHCKSCGHVIYQEYDPLDELV